MTRSAKVYLLLMPWTSAFALSSWLYLPGLLLLLILPLLLVGLSLKRGFELNSIDIGLIVFLGSVIFSTTLGMVIHFDEKILNHSLAYSFTIIIWYFGARILFEYSSLNIESIVSLIHISVLVVAILGLIEFVFKNYYSIDLDVLISRPLSMRDYAPTFAGLIRVRSVVEESGHLSLLLEIFAPVIIYSSQKRINIYHRISYLMIVVCFVLTFSSVGFLLLCLNLFIVAVSKMKRSPIFRFVFIGFIVFLGFYYSSFFVFMYDNLITNKMISHSGSRRLDSIVSALVFMRDGSLLNILFGHGPGSYEILGLDSVISLYANLLLELGLLGFSIFVYILLRSYFSIKSVTNDKLRFGLKLSFINATLHYFFIGNYWYPWIWLLLILILISNKNDCRREKKYILDNK